MRFGPDVARMYHRTGKQEGAGEIGQWAKEMTMTKKNVKAEDLSSIPATHIVEEKTNS